MQINKVRVAAMAQWPLYRCYLRRIRIRLRIMKFDNALNYGIGRNLQCELEKTMSHPLFEVTEGC